MKQVQYIVQFGFICAICSFLAACSQTADMPIYDGPCTPAPQRATSRPYKINGIWYYPQPHYEYEEVGIASYYGGGDVFHGRPTATGETFDMNGITAAHKTLPLPCIVEVVNLENGRQLNLKVNDRGPFISGRIIDVSRRVAQLLGFEGKGTAQVRVRTMVPESLALLNIPKGAPVMLAQASSPASDVAAAPVVYPPSPQSECPSVTSLIAAAISPSAAHATSSGKVIPAKLEKPLLSSPSKTSPSAMRGIFVDVGGYATREQAKQISEALAHVTSISVQSIEKSGKHPYVVRVGPFPNMSEANHILEQVGETGHTSRLVILQL